MLVLCIMPSLSRENGKNSQKSKLLKNCFNYTTFQKHHIKKSISDTTCSQNPELPLQKNTSEVLVPY